MIDLSRHVFEPLRKDEDSILYRGRKQEDLSQVLVLAPTKEEPEPQILKRFEHEYSLKEELDSAWAARPIAITFHWNRPVLVLEDPGAIPLDQLPGRASDLGSSLRRAISLATAIGHLHQCGIVHKDIKPANVLVNSATGQAWLMGFGIASRLPRERQSPDLPEFIAGTLAYMAPEQTGRMNRSTDSRSDLYSYGVTLYEMLTGYLPFTASDAMEWVHCHVARRPTPPDGHAKEIPRAISAIVMRLLAKTAEERYQTAAGVESDLRRCLVEWENLGRINSFSVGTHDVSDRLWIPERLYGRDQEVKVLLDAFERVVAGGTSRLALVSGYSGIGKSSVVNELQKAIVLPRGIFIAGKFDQLRRDIPYATLAQAFQALIRQILGKNEDEMDHWRKIILQAVGSNGQLISNLIPALELIIGKQPPVPELPPQETQNRFQAVFRRFLCVFAQKEHPLTLFLDDLQWLDVATLTFIEHLLTHPEAKHLLIVGAYRDNEVSPSHPLMLTLESIRKVGVIVDEIVLKPLSFKDVNHFIADALRCERKRSGTLARLVHKKTAGNPFFVIQFLSGLAEEHLVEFNARETAWQWELARIHTRGFTDNVVELMIGKLRRLPVATQEVLKHLACLGDNAKMATLSIVNGRREQEIDGAIWEAVHAGLVLKLPGSYKFLHDRVQEAAYSLIPPELRPEVHLRIGRLLIERMSPKEIAESIFDVVNQLNRAIDLIGDPEERLSLLRLNVMAGMKARAAIAYTSARNYLALAKELLPPDAWDERYQETFDLYLAFSECEYLVGNFAAADKLFDLILAKAISNLDRAKVYGLRMKLYQVAGKYDDGVTVALEALRLFGVTFPESDQEIQAAAAAELADVPIKAEYRRILGDKLKKLQLWADNCPENYRNRQALVLAEIARIERRNFDAMRLYEDAIQSARQNGFIQNEAVAYELAARFYTTSGFETIAQTYIRNARYCYLRWGALGKVRQIDQQYPLLKEDRAPSAVATIETPVEHLDLGMVMRVSQAVSGEILLEQLVQKLMVIAVEHAGAERGLLILPYGEAHRIAAEARTGRDEVEVQLRQAPVTRSDLPDSLLRYVMRTQESVILDDASVQNLFSEDEYIRQQRPRSILCLPLVKQARLKGVLYLENNLAPRVFTTERLSVLELIASQAAISLDHARLYADLLQENNDRRKAEEALRASEERWSMLAENSSAGIALIAPDGRFIAANLALQDMLGYTEAELKERTISSISHAEDRADTEARLAHAYTGQRRVYRVEKRYLRKDCTLMWADVSSVFVPSTAGNSGFFTVVIIDITKRKRAEMSLREAQNELAHVSRVTTMGELTASIAHEVNQPLAGMVTNAHASLRWLAGDLPNLTEAREAIRRVIRDGNRAGDVISRMRALFKKAHAAKEPVDINELIQEVLTLTQTELQKNRVSLRTEFANDLPRAIGDRMQLQQVILNLVINAIEAMTGIAEGPRELWVSSKQGSASPAPANKYTMESNVLTQPESGAVLITVGDSGPGLDPTELGRVFETFYTTKHHGLGMGLAISRSIIEAHGGRLQAMANAPRGAVFQFMLPISDPKIS